MIANLNVYVERLCLFAIRCVTAVILARTGIETTALYRNVLLNL
jgi:hypothetical protein